MDISNSKKLFLIGLAVLLFSVLGFQPVSAAICDCSWIGPYAGLCPDVCNSVCMSMSYVGGACDGSNCYCLSCPGISTICWFGWECGYGGNPCNFAWTDIYHCNGYGACNVGPSSDDDPDDSSCNGIQCGVDYYDDWVNYCDGDNLRKKRLFHDFYCASGSCDDHTSWQDDQLVENCNDQDGWYDYDPIRIQWVSATECAEKEQKEQYYSDCYCLSNRCVYSAVSETRWVDTGNTRNKLNGTSCGIETRTCTAGTNCSCESGKYVCDTDTDKTCDKTCFDGICQSCTPSVCDRSNQGVNSDGDGYDIECGDCDDSDISVYPGATEICDDGIDNDCDGQTDCVDSDCSGDPACDSNENCDVCTSNSWYWDTDGGATCDGDYGNKDFAWEGGLSPRCCGDDAGEYYVTQGVGSGACCNSASDCVTINGVCMGEYPTERTCDDGLDNDCDSGGSGWSIDCSDSDCYSDPVCVVQADDNCDICAGNSWYWDTGYDGFGFECDGVYGQQDFTWEAGLSPRCCGNDAGECYEYRYVHTCTDNQCPSFSTDANDDACCNSIDCVHNGTCYATWGGRHTIAGENLCCFLFNWYDCDYSQNTCEQFDLCNYGSNAWVIGGESSAFGEYDTGTSIECCGDDANEYYVTQGVGSGACCNSASDCVDSGNICRDEYSGETTCADGIDNDCDGLIDLNDPDCCISDGQPCSLDSECCTGNCFCNICGGSCDYLPACSNTRCLSDKTYQTEGTDCCGGCNGVWTNAGADSDFDTYDNQCEAYDNDPCSVNSLLDNCDNALGGSCAKVDQNYCDFGCVHCGDGIVNCSEDCEIGNTRSCSGTCGIGTEYCKDDCSGWHNCDAPGCDYLPVCSPLTETQSCGNCGTQTRTRETACCGDCTGWSSWSACTGEGVCFPDATQSCGNCGLQTCSATCSWGSCDDKKADGETCSLGSECCTGSCVCNICGGSCDYSPACSNTRCLSDKTYQTEGTDCCGGCNGVWTNAGADSDFDTYDNQCEAYDNDPCSVNSLLDNCDNALGGSCAKVDQNYCDFGCVHCGDGIVNCSEDCEGVVDCPDPGECKYITCVDCVCVPENYPDSTECGADFYDDWVNYCKEDEYWKHHSFHDFYCVSGNCDDHTSWQDDQLVKDCSFSGNWDGDAIECNCDCNGYDVQESVTNGNCSDGKDNDCDGLIDEHDPDCKEVFSSATLYSKDIPTQPLTYFISGKQFSWNDNKPANTDVKYRIEYYNGISWQIIPDIDLPGNSAGLHISPINISCIDMDYSQIRLRANLSTTNTLFSPLIQDWNVNYYCRNYILPEPFVTIGGEESP